MGIYCIPIKPLLSNATVSILGRISKVRKRPLRLILVISNGKTRSRHLDLDIGKGRRPVESTQQTNVPIDQPIGPAPQGGARGVPVNQPYQQLPETDFRVSALRPKAIVQKFQLLTSLFLDFAKLLKSKA